MKTNFIAALTTLLVGCVMQPSGKDDAKQKPVSPPAARPSVAAAVPGPNTGRFFARDRSGAARELSLKSFSVRATTHPGTVRSHVAMEVATANEGQSEAVMRLAVPPGAAVTGAVLWIDGRPMNGAVVERQRATAVYESVVRRRRDPALVTWDGPGWIAASIFPLEPNQPRRFELEWVEPAAVVDGQVRYRAPTISDGERVIGRAELQVDGRKLAVGDGAPLAIARAEGRAVVAGRVPGDPFQHLLVQAPPAKAAPRFVLVAETSAAMALADRVRQHELIASLLHELPAGARVTLLAADWDTSVIAEDAEAGAWPDALARIDRIVSAGALHLERALLAAAAKARAHDADTVLFVGRGRDGFRGDALRAPLAALHAARLRLSVVAVGGDGAPPAIADAAAKTGGDAIAARAPADTLPAIRDALRPRPAPPTIDARGAGEWYALRTITGETVWLGRALEGPTVDKIAGVDGARDADALALDLAPLWHRARLEWPARGAGAPAAPPDVLTPSTALLVLETEQDYARFGLAAPEPAPADQHHAEEKKSAGIMGLLERKSGPSPIIGRDSALGADGNDVLGHLVAEPVAPAFGVGGLGAVGTGSGGTGRDVLGLGNLGTIGASAEGGNGSGYGRGAGALGARHAREPDVVPGVAAVRGNLDKEIIRRIIRRHINEVRFCYDQQLAAWPGLRGRVVVQFTIRGNGDVIASMLQSSTVANGPLESCIVQAVKRWQFPYPLGGGLVSVSYPFVLTPGESTGSAAATPSTRTAIEEALAIVAGRGDAGDRVQRIAALLGVPPTADPEVLAWTVERRDRPFEIGMLVARLLHLARRDHEAVRVLSESAGVAPRAIAAELRALGADADAREVIRLAAR